MKELTLKHRRFSTACRVGKRNGSGDRVLTFQISTERVALDDGVLLADGLRSDDYMANPIVLLNHDYGTPIGRTARLERNADGWEADVEFPPLGTSKDADRTFDFYSWMGHGAASVGFMVTARAEPTEDERTKYGFNKNASWAWIGREWKLLEWSIVAVPADPGAIMKSTGAEARAMRRALAEAMIDRIDKRASDGMESTEAPMDEPKKDDTEAKPDGMAEVAKTLAEIKAGQATIAGVLAKIAETLGNVEDPIDSEEDSMEEAVAEKSAAEAALYERLLSEATATVAALGLKKECPSKS